MVSLPPSAALPSVTVVVLSYNSRQHLETCFRSLLALRYPAEQLELMLVDNASTDGSLEFAASRFPQITTVANPENYGFARGNNEGARRARGQWVAFLNPDMRVASDWLVELAAPMQRDPDIVCVASKILSWDGRRIDFAGSGMNVLGYGYQEGWGDPATTHDQEKLILAPCGGAMLTDRQVFLDSGGFDEDYFAFYEDLDWGWRLWVMGHKVVYAPRAIAYHIHHGSWKRVSNEKIVLLYQRNAFSTLFKNYGDEQLSRVLPAALLLYLRRAYLATRVDSSRVRSEPRAIAPHLYTEVPHINTPRRRALGSAGQQTYNIAYYLREAWRTLRDDGPGELWRKAAIEARNRWQNRPRLPRSPSRRVNRRAGPGRTSVDKRTVSHLIAADDLAQDLPRLMQKRQVVQSRRRRSDQEIFALFRWPLGADYPNSYYIQTLQDLAEACGIQNFFGQEQEPTQR